MTPARSPAPFHRRTCVALRCVACVRCVRARAQIAMEASAGGGAGGAAGRRWYFTREQLDRSPSRRAGLDPDKELSYRQQAANLLQDMGQRLNVYPAALGRARPALRCRCRRQRGGEGRAGLGVGARGSGDREDDRVWAALGSGEGERRGRFGSGNGQARPWSRESRSRPGRSGQGCAGRRPGLGAGRTQPGAGGMQRSYSGRLVGVVRFLNGPFSSQLTINTAIVYMHRFYMVQSFTQFHRNVSAPRGLAGWGERPGSAAAWQPARGGGDAGGLALGEGVREGLVVGVSSHQRLLFLLVAFGRAWALLPEGMLGLVVGISLVYLLQS